MAIEISKEEYERRSRGVAHLCSVLGTARAYICDPLLTLGMDMPSIDPCLLEKWLRHIGKGPRENESLQELLERHYGKEIAELAESLL